MTTTNQPHLDHSARQSRNGTDLPLHAGDWVEVRSKAEMLRTLDKGGPLEALPFMLKMLQYCDQRFHVSNWVHKACDTAYAFTITSRPGTTRVAGSRRSTICRPSRMRSERWSGYDPKAVHLP